ncbi:hypothetical protein AKG98_3917 [Moritella sp. JT01]|uniref:DUF4238 domain-containing protein n=1 Tax=Moritella sp. JT01 TaxID=756698 RepID=UPI00079761B8|nr:DUF4238 domain-containing protein [Moritella sp. JT01]KXO12722.1 hypothetical protein AKG98_3917 [Moritella sp. JT01]
MTEYIKNTDSIEKQLQAKIKHHHVWADYLKRWSLDNKNVCYMTAKKNIVCDSVRGVAMEKNFYQVKFLSQEQVIILKMLSSKSPDYLRKQHETLLDKFLLMQALELKYKQSGIKDIKAEKMLHAWKCNSIENLHTAHEKEALPIIEALANQDLTVLEDIKNMCWFMQFFAQQIARTKNFKDTISTAHNSINNHAHQELAKTIEESWWFISYILGMNMGADMFATREEDYHCLLINDTETAFITSDQPVINVHQALSDEIKPPEDHECDFYYPISPTVAYMVNKSNRFESGRVQVSVDLVEEMNIKIAKRANIHIFGNSKEILKRYQKHVGTNWNAIKDFKT